MADNNYSKYIWLAVFVVAVIMFIISLVAYERNRKIIAVPTWIAVMFYTSLTLITISVTGFVYSSHEMAKVVYSDPRWQESILTPQEVTQMS